MAKWPRYFDLFLMLLQLSLGIVISQAAIVDMEKACRVPAAMSRCGDAAFFGAAAPEGARGDQLFNAAGNALFLRAQFPGQPFTGAAGRRPELTRWVWKARTVPPALPPSRPARPHALRSEPLRRRRAARRLHAERAQRGADGRPRGLARRSGAAGRRSRCGVLCVGRVGGCAGPGPALQREMQ